MDHVKIENVEPARSAELKGLHVAILWLVLTLALLPVMAFLISTEREVSQYSALTFESSARAALADGDYNRAIRVCSGALRTALERSDYWGLAYLLRAQGYADARQPLRALTDLEIAARLWTRHYYYPSEDQRGELKQFGLNMAAGWNDKGNVEEACLAFSAAGMGSGRPVEFLYEADHRFKGAGWPQGPFLVVEDFQDAAVARDELRQTSWFEKPYISKRDLKEIRSPLFESWAEEQGRAPIRSVSDPTGSRTGSECAMLDLGASTQEGRAWYSIPTYIPVSEKPFALRLWVKAKQPVELAVVLEYWFEFARKAAVTIDDKSESAATGDGWRVFDIRRDFFKERAEEAKQKGYDPTGGIIQRIGLSIKPGSANQIWVDRIELYLPNAK